VQTLADYEKGQGGMAGQRGTFLEMEGDLLALRIAQAQIWDVRAVTDLAFCRRMPYYHFFFIPFSSLPLFQVFLHLPSFPLSSNHGENIITDMWLGEFWIILDMKMKCVHVKVTSCHATVAVSGSL
jgi:hypothetical protein